MRIVSYNILSGGEGRADPIAEVLLAQRADVIALIESDNVEVVDRLATRLDMDFVTARTDRGCVTLFSKWDIVESMNAGALHSEGPRALLKALVRTPEGIEVSMGVLHLHSRAMDSDETQRQHELNTVLTQFERERTAALAHLLMGDFNANSPVQVIDPEKVKPSTAKAIRAQGGLPRRAIQMLLDAGYVDTLHAVSPDLAKSNGTFTTQFPGQRVDYIFAHSLPLASIRAAWIETDRLAKFASDHYPVGAEIELYR